VLLWKRANLDFCKWVFEQERAGRTLSLDALFILNELQYERRINISRAVELTQKTKGDVRSTLEKLVEYGIIKAKREKKGRTYHLAANVYRIFGEKAGYVRTRGFEPIQQQEMVIQYLRAHKYKLTMSYAMVNIVQFGELYRTRNKLTYPSVFVQKQRLDIVTNL